MILSANERIRLSKVASETKAANLGDYSVLVKIIDVLNLDEAEKTSVDWVDLFGENGEAIGSQWSLSKMKALADKDIVLPDSQLRRLKVAFQNYPHFVPATDAAWVAAVSDKLGI